MGPLLTRSAWTATGRNRGPARRLGPGRSPSNLHLRRGGDDRPGAARGRRQLHLEDTPPVVSQAALVRGRARHLSDEPDGRPVEAGGDGDPTPLRLAVDRL